MGGWAILSTALANTSVTSWWKLEPKDTLEAVMKSTSIVRENAWAYTVLLLTVGTCYDQDFSTLRFIKRTIKHTASRDYISVSNHPLNGAANRSFIRLYNGGRNGVGQWMTSSIAAVKGKGHRGLLLWFNKELLEVARDFNYLVLLEILLRGPNKILWQW